MFNPDLDKLQQNNEETSLIGLRRSTGPVSITFILKSENLIVANGFLIHQSSNSGCRQLQEHSFAMGFLVQEKPS